MASETERRRDRQREDQEARLEILENSGRKNLGETRGVIALSVVCLCHELRALRAELASSSAEAAEVRRELDRIGSILVDGLDNGFVLDGEGLEGWRRE